MEDGLILFMDGISDSEVTCGLGAAYYCNQSNLTAKDSAVLDHYKGVSELPDTQLEFLTGQAEYHSPQGTLFAGFLYDQFLLVYIIITLVVLLIILLNNIMGFKPIYPFNRDRIYHLSTSFILVYFLMILFICFILYNYYIYDGS